MQQNPLQLFLSILAAREEVIFMIRIIGHQMHEDCRNRLGTLKELSEEIYRGEQKRENLENFLYQHLGEGYRKLFLPKIIQKYTKITQYYLVKTQIYFPKQGQQLCQDTVNQPNLRATIQQIMHEPLVGILKFIIKNQQQKLKHELSHLLNYEQYIPILNQEKTDPLILGVFGLRYLNDLHRKYCYTVSRHSKRNVYDVLAIDDNTRVLYLQGGGFISLVSSITKLKDKSVDNTQSVYVPVESTVEIITQRYEKLIKELMDQNSHVQKSVNRYYEQYKRYKLKPLPIKSYSTPKSKVQEIKSQRSNQQKTFESGPMLSDMGRYSEPISRNPLLQDFNNSVKLKYEKCRTQKQSDIIMSGFVSPKQTLVRKHRSVKNYDIAFLKPTAQQPFADFPLRIISNKNRKQN
ncbi:unnamed protein product (macronuclear) [Paramecium tetraurelia]|uniref:DH domain-containing protein n=1 Tax=Paramecium tetraurelia TaxID=5888 RepID=A0BPN7_PARTE|nr:uncharacterized protein GSPATT00005254001 [Paramecium tetraurelia]CAK60504.1 unnamed protein product [Paramecium tetraurelia]|eukprot:XP_001427902.1 hypothetical protein (macronuclear) [Paramecium tetraurelia strain d4-2]